jgi:cytochrome c-type biogenesis protein CcmE
MSNETNDDRSPETPAESTTPAPPRPRKTTAAQKKFYVGAAIIVGAIGFMIYSAADTSSNYYYKVSEVIAMGARAEGIPLRIEGKVTPGSINNDAANLKLAFSAYDDSGSSIPVLYEGIAPDMMKDDIAVVVEGKINAQGTIVATRVLTSCPSRYDAAEEMKKEGGMNSDNAVPPHTI